MKWYERTALLIAVLAVLFCNYGLGWSKKFGNEPVTFADIAEVPRIPAMYYMIMGLYFLYYLCFRWIRNIENKTGRVVLAVLASTVATAFGFVPFYFIVGGN